MFPPPQQEYLEVNRLQTVAGAGTFDRRGPACLTFRGGGMHDRHPQTGGVKHGHTG